MYTDQAIVPQVETVTIDNILMFNTVGCVDVA